MPDWKKALRPGFLGQGQQLAQRCAVRTVEGSAFRTRSWPALAAAIRDRLFLTIGEAWKRGYNRCHAANSEAPSESPMSVTDSPLQAVRLRPGRLEFQAARPAHARRLRRHGRRHVDADRAGRPPHHLAGARERAEEFHRGRRLRPAQAQGGLPDRPAAGLHALELAGDHRQRDGGRLSVPEGRPEAGRLRAVRHLQAGEAEVDRVRRLLGPVFARRAPALVRRRRIRPHGVRRGRLRAEPSARRPVLPLLRRAQSLEADRSRPLVAARHAQGRQRAAARASPEARARQGQPRAQHQRLSAAAGPDVPRLSRRRHVRHGHLRQVEAEADLALRQLAALHRLHAHHRAAVRSRAGGDDRRVDLRQRRRLAEADLDPRRPRREQPGPDLDLPDAEPGRLQDPRRPLRRAQHPREHAAADSLAVGPDRPRHVLQRRAARLRHLQRLPAEGSRDLRAAGDRRCRNTHRSSSTTCSSTSARSSTRSIASPAGCTSWRWISD